MMMRLLCLLCMFLLFGCGNGKSELPKDTTSPTSNTTTVVTPIETPDTVSAAKENSEVAVENWLSLHYTANLNSTYEIELQNGDKSNTLFMSNPLSLPLLNNGKWFNHLKINLAELFPEKNLVKVGKKIVGQPLPTSVRKKSIELFSELIEKTVECLNVAKNHESSHYSAPDLHEAKQGNLFCDGKDAEELMTKISQLSRRDTQIIKILKALGVFKKQTMKPDSFALGESVVFDKMNLTGVVCLKKEKTCVLVSSSN